MKKFLFILLLPFVGFGQFNPVAFYEYGKNRATNNPVILMSFRKINYNYSGSAIRVRRSSDNAEMDIGFSGVNLDTASLLSFIGANTGYVVIWYDQSGDANNMVPILANQPIIVNAGTLVVKNGKPAMQIIVEGVFIKNMTFHVASRGNEMCAFMVVSKSAQGDGLLGSVTSGYQYFKTSASNVIFRNNVTNTTFTDNPVLNTQYLLSFFDIRTSNVCRYYRNGVQKGGDLTISGTLTVTPMKLTSQNLIQEIQIFSKNRFADISSIHSEINSYYSIY